MDDAILPAMSPREAAFYTANARRSRCVLEYGSGGSTVVAAECDVPLLYSVDSDARWVARLRQHPKIAPLVEAGRAHLLHVDIGPVGNWGKPKSKLSAWKWPRYARRPWLERDLRPDLVLVDGRFRISCILETLRHAPEARIMVHDFRADKPRVRAVLPFVDVIQVVDKLAMLAARSNVDGLRARTVRLLFRYDRR